MDNQASVLQTNVPCYSAMDGGSRVPAGCPPGLKYLTQVDQVLVHQAVELLEGMFTCLFYIVDFPFGNSKEFNREVNLLLA